MTDDTAYVRGAQRLSQRIQTIRTNLSLPSMVDEITDLLFKRTLQRFDAQVDPDNVPWRPLAAYTLQRRAREGFSPGPILQRTRALRSAIRVIRGAATGATYTNTGANSRIGVTDPDIVPYAAAQNKGTDHIPARRFLGIGRLDVKAVDSLLRRKAAQLQKSLNT
jgi:phage gpG-like protein